MIGCPTFSPWRSTSTTKLGSVCVPNWWLKMSMQELPHDGVAALAVPAVSAPATPTPPTRVSVAAAASTLLLMDMDCSSLGTHSRTLRTAASSWPPVARAVGRLPTWLGTLPAHGGLIRAGTADLIGLAVWRGKVPGKPGRSGAYAVGAYRDEASSIGETKT